MTHFHYAYAVDNINTSEEGEKRNCKIELIIRTYLSSPNIKGEAVWLLQARLKELVRISFLMAFIPLQLLQ